MGITTYQDINHNMQVILNIYFGLNSSENIRNFILGQRNNNKNKWPNRLIELPNGDIKEIIKQQYLKTGKNDKYLQSEIGTVNSKEQQEGIKQMALLLLLCNRTGKECKARGKKVENDKRELLFYNGKNITADVAQKLEKMQAKSEKYNNALKSAMLFKDYVLSDLIANLYVLKHTEKTDKISMLYGNRKDEHGKDAFAIDIAKIGQVCVHYGSKEKMELIRVKAIKKAQTMLNIKHKLGQLSKEEAERLKNEITEENIMPEYKGKLYEYVAGIPIEYAGQEIEKVCKHLGIYKVPAGKITAGDMNAIYLSNELNDREKYYLAVKLGVPDKRLIQLSEQLKQKQVSQNATILGRKMLKATTPEERRNLQNNERRKWKENGKKLQ